MKGSECDLILAQRRRPDPCAIPKLQQSWQNGEGDGGGCGAGRPFRQAAEDPPSLSTLGTLTSPSWPKQPVLNAIYHQFWETTHKLNIGIQAVENVATIGTISAVKPGNFSLCESHKCRNLFGTAWVECWARE